MDSCGHFKNYFGQQKYFLLMHVNDLALSLYTLEPRPLGQRENCADDGTHKP
jgi:hypothetical protein